MLLTDQSNIRDVMLFPAMRALPAASQGPNIEGDTTG
jgi:hypothetical protein